MYLFLRLNYNLHLLLNKSKLITHLRGIILSQSFLDITESSGTEVSRHQSSFFGAGVTINMSGIIVSGNSGDFAGVITARAFDGDGSALTGVSGIGSALSNDPAFPAILGNIFKTTRNYTIPTGEEVTINVPEQDQGRVAFTRLGQIHVATGATITVSAGTTFVMNVLNIF